MAATLVLGACAPKPEPAEPEAMEAPTVETSGSARLFENARRTLLDGDPERALELLEEHQEKYPKDWWGERDGMKLVAMCASGKEAEAMDIIIQRAHAERRAMEEAEKSQSGVTPFSAAPLFSDDMTELTNTTDCTARLRDTFDQITNEPEQQKTAEDEQP